MAFCFKSRDEEEEDKVTKKDIKKKDRFLFEKIDIPPWRNLEQFELKYEQLYEKIPKGKDGKFQKKDLKKTILEHLKLKESDLSEELAKCLEHSLENIFEALTLEKFYPWHTTKNESMLLSINLQNFALSLGKVTKSGFGNALMQMKNQDLKELAKQMGAKIDGKQSSQKIRDQITIFVATNKITTEKALNMAKQIEKAKASTLSQDKAKMCVTSSAKIPNENKGTFQISYQQFHDKLHKFMGLPTSTAYDKYHVKETLLEHMSICESDLDSDLKELLSSNVNILYMKNKKMFSGYGDDFEHDNIYVCEELQDFALSKSKARKRVQPPCDVSMLSLSGALDKLDSDQLISLTKSFGWGKALDSDASENPESIRNAFFQIARDSTNKISANDIMKKIKAIREESCDIEVIEENLEKLTTKECFEIAQKCTDKKIPESLKKKPVQLKILLLKEANSNQSAFSLILDFSNNLVMENTLMQHRLEMLDRPQLIELKKALNVQKSDSHGQPELVKQIFKHAKSTELSYKKLSDIIKSLKKPLLQTENIKEQSKISRAELDSALEPDLVRSNPKPVFVNSETDEALSEDILEKLKQLHKVQLYKVGLALDMTISDTMVKKPSYMADKINKFIKTDAKLHAQCDQQCSVFIEKNAHLSAVAEELTHIELLEMVKFLDIDADGHQTQKRLARQVTEHMIIKDISFPELIEKMQERNQSTIQMADFLKTLPRDKILDLKAILQGKNKYTKARSNKSSPEICGQIMKIAASNLLCMNDIQMLASRSLKEDYDMKFYLRKDLSIIGIGSLQDLARDVAPKAPIMDDANEYCSGQRSPILFPILISQANLKLVSHFFDFNSWVMSDYFYTLSELDSRGLLEVAEDIQLPFLKEPFGTTNGAEALKGFSEDIQIQTLVYKIMEEFKNRSYNVFKSINIENYPPFDATQHLSNVLSRHPSPAPNWHTLKCPEYFLKKPHEDK